MSSVSYSRQVASVAGGQGQGRSKTLGRCGCPMSAGIKSSNTPRGVGLGHGAGPET